MGLLGNKYALEVQNKYKRVQNGLKKEPLSLAARFNN
jgi:hypothetical protein